MQTPPPQANFFSNPGDPSSFDTVQFYNQSYDPGGLGISTADWSLGDGTTASGCCPSHRHSADGDYVVKLSVTTPDARSGSTTQVLHVRTHDVTIAKLTVPQSARAGQTRQVTVGITDSRYPETVQVQLLKSVAGGQWVTVASSTQSVPVRGENRTTPFTFDYTFTGDDAALGKVSFRAVATIQGARDAFSTDNDVTALPTKVS